MTGILSRRLILYFGRDIYRGPKAYALEFCLFNREQFASWGEIVFRFNLKLGAERPRRVFGTPRRSLFGWVFFAELRLIPAWRDVPSVVAEYRRTME